MFRLRTLVLTSVGSIAAGTYAGYAITNIDRLFLQRRIAELEYAVTLEKDRQRPVETRAVTEEYVQSLLDGAAKERAANLAHYPSTR